MIPRPEPSRETLLLLEITKLRDTIVRQQEVIGRQARFIKLLAETSKLDIMQVVEDIETRLIEMKKSAAVEPSQLVGYRVAFNQAIKAVSNYWKW